jgi:hypothetical protein
MATPPANPVPVADVVRGRVVNVSGSDVSPVLLQPHQLDPDQRLPVHVHPDKAFARRHLALDHGKTEAWIVLEAPAGAGVGLGWAGRIGKGQVLEPVARHDTAALDGTGEVCTEHGGGVRVRRGDALVVQWAAGRWRTEGPR